jgi:hypothetical protein
MGRFIGFKSSSASLCEFGYTTGVRTLVGRPSEGGSRMESGQKEIVAEMKADRDAHVQRNCCENSQCHRR